MKRLDFAMNILFHSTEGYIANVAPPISYAYALKNIELISKYLSTCVKDGNNLEARTYLALANTLSGFIESTSRCTSEHSMDHALSAHYPKLPHGAGLMMLAENALSAMAELFAMDPYSLSLDETMEIMYNAYK